jgi:hypothetical protein
MTYLNGSPSLQENEAGNRGGAEKALPLSADRRREIIAAALSCQSAAIFQATYPQLYADAQEYDLMREIWRRAVPGSREIMGAATSCRTRDEFRLNHPAEHRNAIALDILSEIHELYPTPDRWSRVQIEEEASKYHCYEDFLRDAPSAVSAARRLDIFQEITDPLFRRREKWSAGKSLGYAKAYASLADFQKAKGKAGRAYNASMHHGWMRDISARVWPRAGSVRDCPTAIYRLSKDGYAYIGLADGDLSRAIADLRADMIRHPEIARLATTGHVEVLQADTRHEELPHWKTWVAGDVKEGWMMRPDAIRAEIALIRQCALDPQIKLLNLYHNIQYMPSSNRWTWGGASI